MYYFDDKQHHTPHIHVQYNEDEAIISISDGQLISGNIKSNKLTLVQAWVEIHREELIANWRLAVEGQQVFKIEPLR